MLLTSCGARKPQNTRLKEENVWLSRHRCSLPDGSWLAGWAIDSRQTTNLVLNALYLAVEAGLVRSMETIGDGYDNVMIELFGGIMHG